MWIIGEGKLMHNPSEGKEHVERVWKNGFEVASNTVLFCLAIVVVSYAVVKMPLHLTWESNLSFIEVLNFLLKIILSVIVAIPAIAAARKAFKAFRSERIQQMNVSEDIKYLRGKVFRKGALAGAVTHILLIIVVASCLLVNILILKFFIPIITSFTVAVIFIAACLVAYGATTCFLSEFFKNYFIKRHLEELGFN